jgi:hypothetical protein
LCPAPPGVPARSSRKIVSQLSALRRTARTYRQPAKPRRPFLAIPISARPTLTTSSPERDRRNRLRLVPLLSKSLT